MLPLFWLKCNIKFGPQKGTSHLDRYWAKFYRRKMWHKKGLPILDIIGQVFFFLSVDNLEHKKVLNSDAGLGLDFGREIWQMRDADEQKSKRTATATKDVFSSVLII